jgi:ubiquitin-protein ligase E3 A
VVHALDDERKKKLLFFATGTDRIPLGGLGKLSFTIARNGSDSDR